MKCCSNLDSEPNLKEKNQQKLLKLKAVKENLTTLQDLAELGLTIWKLKMYAFFDEK